MALFMHFASWMAARLDDRGNTRVLGRLRPVQGPSCICMAGICMAGKIRIPGLWSSGKGSHFVSGASRRAVGGHGLVACNQ